MINNNSLEKLRAKLKTEKIVSKMWENSFELAYLKAQTYKKALEVCCDLSDRCGELYGHLV